MMDSNDIPLLSMLRSRLGYLSQRQRVISQNVANADTPGFKPQDLKPFSYHAEQAAMAGSAAGGQAVTQPGHMQLGGGANAAGGQAFKATNTKDSETTLDGNSVVLEEEMMKMSDARMNYDAAVSFYQKSLDLLRMAAKKPG
jgi:flagellar basal-body rod protein FlgB